MDGLMLSALGIFLVTYALMLAFSKIRPYIALGAAALFIILGTCGVYDNISLLSTLASVDYNILLMIAGTMGLVTLFIESKMPARLSEMIIAKVPNVKWAVTLLALFSGLISAFVDNVATVLMLAPIGLAISRKLKISPVPVLIAIAVSSNLQGAATLVGDTTSMMLGTEAGMNFFDFFWMDGKPGIFFAVELGAVASALILLWLFRKHKEPVDAKVETEVSDYTPTAMLLITIAALMGASFIPAPAASSALAVIYDMRSGLICAIICIIAILISCIRKRSAAPVKSVWADFDKDTVLLLFGLFMVVGSIKAVGVIDAIGDAFTMLAGGNMFLLYTIIVFASVLLSAFIDNIPYTLTMLGVVGSLAPNIEAKYLLCFGLLIGATLGGNLTPIGASANIAAIGILRKEGETVKTSDFLKIGVPFTLAAVLTGYAFIWIFWGV